MQPIHRLHKAAGNQGDTNTILGSTDMRPPQPCIPRTWHIVEVQKINLAMNVQHDVDSMCN